MCLLTEGALMTFAQRSSYTLCGAALQTFFHQQHLKSGQTDKCAPI